MLHEPFPVSSLHYQHRRRWRLISLQRLLFKLIETRCAHPDYRRAQRTTDAA
jgi:hypothetical protein